MWKKYHVRRISFQSLKHNPVKNLHTKYDINNFLGIKLFCMWQSDEDPSDLHFDQNFVSTGTWKKTESSRFKKLVKFYPFQFLQLYPNSEFSNTFSGGNIYDSPKLKWYAHTAWCQSMFRMLPMLTIIALNLSGKTHCF